MRINLSHYTHGLLLGAAILVPAFAEAQTPGFDWKGGSGFGFPGGNQPGCVGGK